MGDEPTSLAQTVVVLQPDQATRIEVNHNDQTVLNYPANKNPQEQWPLMEQGLQNDITLPEKTTVSGNMVLDKRLEADEENVEQRETWGGNIDFLLSIIGFAVDLANVWRFPYYCYKNGGGAFLIPYFLMLFFGAIPLFFMELVLGQFHREGAISVWKIAPIFKGIGMCECLIAYYVAFYYNVIIAWSLYYLVASFTVTLPWTRCDHSWNSPQCDEGNNFTVIGNSTVAIRPNGNISSAAEYFELGVLGMNSNNDLDNIGAPRWQLVLCLMGVLLMLYFSLWKGVKSSGKVVWVTATMPYVVLTILLIRGLMLPGSSEGILYFITPNLSKLLDPEVWIDAAVQIFYSVGAGFGVHIAYASYNKFHNNIRRDCLATVCVNSFTSLFSGFVVFSYLGYIALKQGTTIDKVAAEGPGLVFIIYPEAIATLPGSVGWSIIFFIMLLTLGLDSAMGGLEAVLTGLKDEFRHIINRHRYGRELITLFLVASVFCLALQNVTNGGIYLVNMWDTFSAGTAILFGVFSQAVAVSWFYGLEQFCSDIEKMLGFRPGLYWRICWKFISPIFIFIIVVSSIVSFKPMEYVSYTLGTYTYPSWSNSLGWCIAASSMILIPLAAAYQFFKVPGSWKQKLAVCISPYWEHRDIQRGGVVKRFQAKHWLSL